MDLDCQKLSNQSTAGTALTWQAQVKDAILNQFLALSTPQVAAQYLYKEIRAAMKYHKTHIRPDGIYNSTENTNF